MGWQHRLSLGWITRRAPAILVTVWAGFWGWFSLASGFTGPDHSIFVSLGSTAILVVLALCSWMKPRLGGVLLVVFAVWSFFFFDHDFTRGVLAAPALVLGVVQAANLVPARSSRISRVAAKPRGD